MDMHHAQTNISYITDELTFIIELVTVGVAPRWACLT